MVQQQQEMLHTKNGDYSPSLFFTVPVCVVSVTLLIIYEMSQYYEQEPPFPQCWISDCAAHYPQYIFFRIATISGSALIILGWFVNGLFLRTLKQEHTIRISSIHFNIPTILGMMGAMLLMGSTANIDTGKRKSQWHTACASSFFVLTLLAQIYNTAVGWALHLRSRHTKHSINKYVLYFKSILVALIALQFYISSIYGSQHHIDIVLEWTLTLTILAGFYAISLDVKPFNFIYALCTKNIQRDPLLQ